MQRSKQEYPIGKIFLGVTSPLVAIAVLIFACHAMAAGCFPDLYYNAMFRPYAQQAYAGGDSRLVGMSDYLAAKGQDPHDKGGSGCMCGVNNGRWDQVLVNRSELEPELAPVTFKINAVTATLFDREGTPQNTGFEIKPSAVSRCLDGALKTRGWFPWRLGLLAKPGFLEPGENILGCVCLKSEDRSKSGFVKLKVEYTPLVLVHPVPDPKATPKVQGRHLELTDTYELGRLHTGAVRYFRILQPDNENWKLRGVDVKLQQAGQLVLLTSPVWEDKLCQWRKGPLKDTALGSGGLWVLVGATGRAAQGILMVRLTLEFEGDSEHFQVYKPVPVELEKIKVGHPGTRIFKSYVLGMASKTQNDFDTATQRPCCDGTR